MKTFVSGQFLLSQEKNKYFMLTHINNFEKQQIQPWIEPQ